MNRNQIFGPVLVQVLLTLVVYLLLARAKARAVKLGQVDMARRALHQDAWPENVMKINNNISNQFELPVLFYAACFALWALDAVGSRVPRRPRIALPRHPPLLRRRNPPPQRMRSRPRRRPGMRRSRPPFCRP